MTEPLGGIRYTKSADGTAIGYEVSGSGPVVALVPTMGTCLEVSTQRPYSTSRTVWGTRVSYDRRGAGFSQRDAHDFSLEAMVADLAAVVDAVSSEPIVVYGTYDGGPVAMRFAAEFPDRVSHLVLASTFASGAQLYESVASLRVLHLALREDWDYYVRLASRVQYDADRPLSDVIERAFRNAMSQEATLAHFDALTHYDVSGLAGSITAPTILIQQTRVPSDQHAHAAMRRLAMDIPGATLVQAGPDDYWPMVRDFVGHDDTPATPGAFRTIMFTDLVSSTALTQRLGDDAAQRVVETHDAAVRAALTEHSGVEIKHTGDGIMAAFDSATAAARAAHQIATTLTESGVGVRVGLNAGEPIERDGDLFGTAVQLAARVGDRAGEGQVLATQVVRDLTAGKGLEWSPAPVVDAKGIEDPVVVFTLDLG